MNKSIILTLLNIPKVSRKTINSMINIKLEKSLNEEILLNMFLECRIENKRIPIPKIADIRNAIQKSAEIIEQCNRENIGIITILDDDFPDKLKIINNNPVILFYKGNKECLNVDKSVAIIGTRNPTEHGSKIAERLGYLFGEDNFVVVSGLAKGCDEFAHIGCVKANGKSIAVLPCGLDNIYPASNKKLANQILEEGGCLLSEYQIGQKPFKNLFVERDRLQSGLSAGVIVVETTKCGGTMHTVNFSKEQGKVLGCYKHKDSFKNEEQVQGNIALLNDGVTLSIDSPESINLFKRKLLNKSEDIPKDNRDVPHTINQMTFDTIN